MHSLCIFIAYRYNDAYNANGGAFKVLETRLSNNVTPEVLPEKGGKLKMLKERQLMKKVKIIEIPCLSVFITHEKTSYFVSTQPAIRCVSWLCSLSCRYVSALCRQVVSHG